MTMLNLGATYKITKDVSVKLGGITQSHFRKNETYKLCVIGGVPVLQNTLSHSDEKAFKNTALLIKWLEKGTMEEVQ